MILTDKKRATIEDYEQLPEGAPYQLIGGELIMSPSPTRNHQDIASNIDFALKSFIIPRHLGRVYFAPLDVQLSDTDVYQPDILFIRQERLSLITSDRVNIAPDLVIEILSPSTAYYDLKHKKEVYYEHGVSEYWIVDPADESVEIMTRNGGFFRTESMQRKTGILHSPMFSDFSMKVEEVFAF
jgi:Uma2 family endonuclease